MFFCWAGEGWEAAFVDYRVGRDFPIFLSGGAGESGGCEFLCRSDKVNFSRRMAADGY